MMYLVGNPNKSAKEISEATEIGYKNAFKILQDLLLKEIVSEKDKKYFIKKHFISHIKQIHDSLLKNYSQELLFRNKFDLYNMLSASYSDDKIVSKIDGIIDDWLMKKLDEWYSKYYDPENKEYLEVKKIINSKFNKKANILEIGTGTGRFAFKLAKDFTSIVAIDKEKDHVDYCKKTSKHNNLEFVQSTARDFKSQKKFDVVVFSWIGFHYQEDYREMMENIDNHMNKDSMIIILDAYSETEYVKILQLIDKRDMDESKAKKEKIKEFLAGKYGNIEQKVLFTNYIFPSIEEVVNNFKIEATLEESHFWTKEDEHKVRQYLGTKEKPLEIQEGLWITTINKKSTR